MVSFQTFFVAHPCPLSRPPLASLPMPTTSCRAFRGGGSKMHIMLTDVDGECGPGAARLAASTLISTLSPASLAHRQPNEVAGKTGCVLHPPASARTWSREKPPQRTEKRGGVGCAGNTPNRKESRHQPTSVCSFWTQFLNCVHFIVAPD